MKIEILDITASNVPEATQVLARAFLTDPFARHLFSGHEEDFEDRLHDLFEFSVARRIEFGWPVLGAVVNRAVVGAACISPVDEKPWPRGLTDAMRGLMRRLGPAAARRLEGYSRITERHRPSTPHFYLGTIGVDPAWQGQGVGGALFSALHGRSEAHPRSTGVGLDTENPDNVPLYRHLGYRTVAAENYDGLDIWCMFRPNRGTR